MGMETGKAVMKKEQYNLIIAEDNLIMQKYLTGLMEEDGRFVIKGVYRDAFDAEERCKQGDIDLVIMDVQTLHNHSGLAVGERIRSAKGKAKILIVTSLVDPEIMAKAKAGAADSLWYKDYGGHELMEVIERTLAGERLFPEEAPNVELKEMFSHDISPRQLAILRRYVSGMTYEEIAGDMKMTKNGVRWNIDQIVDKGGFQNKHEMLASVIENKLIVTTLEDGEDL